ncbi:hypothetical protein I5G63_gp061 [Mycobacterium phage Imvubu]|uniref:Ribbon-helix-helix DNA binding domain protein n=1 Tax=Mycobacterium phage Imvubu TaxID=2686233 RepID=A0A6B9L7M8_9CAUD|nr:hypothetical protein I5G63_gp061 [Mycobacterium phage Imvubu]QHB37802.1 hypothetical protein PBI_IMVUBU_61 [Mycobacterium phage Imvubu]
MTMSTRSRTRIASPGKVLTVLLPIKIAPDQRQRFKVKAAQHGKTYAEMLQTWMDQDDARLERAQRAQAHPLHRPNEAKSIYPGGGTR